MKHYLILWLLAIPLYGQDKPKVFDHKYTAAVAFDFAATTADVVTTLKGLDSGRCTEGNPIYGAHPSAARASLIAYGYTGGITIFSYVIKRRHPDSKAAWISHLILGGSHATVAGFNARCF